MTYLPMARGFLYLVPIMDWHSRYVVAWRLSNTLEAGFCAEALQEALGQGRPQVFNPISSIRYSIPSSPPSPPTKAPGWACLYPMTSFASTGDPSRSRLDLANSRR